MSVVWSRRVPDCSDTLHNWYELPSECFIAGHQDDLDNMHFCYPYGRLIGQPSTLFSVPLRSICSIKISFFENTKLKFSKKVFSFCFSKSTFERGHFAPKIIKNGSRSSENEQIEVSKFANRPISHGSN